MPSFSTFHRCWEANPNGAGFVYPSTTDLGQPGIRLVKGLMTFSAFKDAIQRHREHFTDAENRATKDVAFHFRIASAGGTSPELTHPFSAGRDVALMHNGHISALAYDYPIVDASAPTERIVRKTSERLGEEKEIRAAIKSGELTPHEARTYLRLYGRVAPGTTLAEIKDKLASPRPPESDTSRLAMILAELPLGWQRNRTCHHLIRETFLHGDKIVLMDAQGLAGIINESGGEWLDGCWYSNTYWKPDDRYAGRLVSGQEMLADEEKAEKVEKPLKLDVGRPYQTDRELRAKSDANKARYATTSEKLWPTREEQKLNKLLEDEDTDVLPAVQPKLPFKDESNP